LLSQTYLSARRLEHFVADKTRHDLAIFERENVVAELARQAEPMHAHNEGNIFLVSGVPDAADRASFDRSSSARTMSTHPFVK